MANLKDLVIEEDGKIEEVLKKKKIGTDLDLKNGEVPNSPKGGLNEHEEVQKEEPQEDEAMSEQETGSKKDSTESQEDESAAREALETQGVQEEMAVDDKDYDNLPQREAARNDNDSEPEPEESKNTTGIKTVEFEEESSDQKDEDESNLISMSELAWLDDESESASLQDALLKLAKNTILEDISQKYDSGIVKPDALTSLISAYTTGERPACTNWEVLLSSVIDEIVKSDYTNEHYHEHVRAILKAVQDDLRRLKVD